MITASMSALRSAQALHEIVNELVVLRNGPPTTASVAVQRVLEIWNMDVDRRSPAGQNHLELTAHVDQKHAPCTDALEPVGVNCINIQPERSTLALRHAFFRNKRALQLECFRRGDFVSVA